MNNIILTKSSTENQIKSYFLKVLDLKQSNEQFPVDLEEVWPLVYPRKEEAVRYLKSEFIQDVDYQVLRKNAENPLGGRPTDIYKLTLSCMEYFIARKVQPVFNVYRSVFHQSVESGFRIPQTYSEALRLAADKEEENQKLLIENKALESENKRMQPRDQFVDIVFNSNKLLTMSEAAKSLKLKYGRNTLCKKLREIGIFYKSSNEPKQEYISCGYFEYKPVEVGNGRIIMQPFCSSRGLGYIAKKLGVIMVPETQITITVNNTTGIMNMSNNKKNK